MEIISPQFWKEYELIDSGDFEKLERFGRWVLRRPEPQAVWSKTLTEKQWQKQAHGKFVQGGSASGTWEKYDPDLPDQWHINYRSKAMSLRFRLALTGFKHVGIFPEQAANWEFIHRQARQIKQPRVLNLFAYTGGATLAARAAGADVIHCDSIKQVVSWANTNMQLSKLDGIRWLVEDAFKFVKKEARRGNTYHGIILDPPAWGHGPKGEKWKLEASINELVGLVQQILDPDQRFMVFNAYSLGFSSIILQNLVRSHFGPQVAEEASIGELCLDAQTGHRLPTGVFVRIGKNKK